ncbi:MAG: 4a-hydroxytetrahydrobiopterin dehydratase [Phycisphaeraceae bacterium]|nr:4a-hydroxytetrahydrobiopterin dehydratase [Phycisphaeraceae bacterium]
MAKQTSRKPPEPTPEPPQRLSPDEIVRGLAALPEWSDLGGSIQRTYQFENFIASMAFVGKVAAQAEAVQHHPDILIRYNKVTLTLSTHDAGNTLTAKDFDMARRAEEAAGNAAAP